MSTESGAPIFGYVSDRYWEDVGTLESYLKAQADVLNRKVDTDIAGFELSPGVWVAEGAEVDPDAVLTGPGCVGDCDRIQAASVLSGAARRSSAPAAAWALPIASSLP